MATSSKSNSKPKAAPKNPRKKLSLADQWAKLALVRIPLIVTDDSGIVTVHSGDRDRRLEQAGHSAL